VLPTTHDGLRLEEANVIGYRELLILVFLLIAAVATVAIAVWAATRSRHRASAHTSPRSVATRLAELDALRDSGRISPAEYERQRSAIISSI
jgi:hypothetical protein